MHGRLTVLLLSGLLVFGVMTAGTSRGLTQSVDVVVLVDRSAAEYGDKINVTAHVFDRGSPAEPTEISAMIDKLPGITPLPLVRQSIGVFHGEFEFESHPSVVTVNATVGNTQDSGGAVVYHRFNEVRIVPSVSAARPGQSLTLAVETHDRGGSLRDADSMNLTADVFYAPEYARRSPPTVLNWTRMGVGRYSAAYVVPSDLDRDAVVGFRADVVIGSGGSGVGADVFVDFPDPLQVWYRTLAVVGSNATVEIDVASLAGVPVSNATVSLRSGPFAGSVVPDLEGTTNLSGAVRFDLPGPMMALDFHGNVTSGSQRQPFSGVLALPQMSNPGEPKLVRENPKDLFGAGETAILRFRLAKGAGPIPNQELFVYAQTASDLILAERVRTDGQGLFEMRFVAPPRFARIDVAGFIEGTWRAFQDDFAAVNRLAATLSSPDGWHLTISGRFPATPEPWIARLSLSTEEEALPGPWIATGSFGAPRVVGGLGGEPFAFEITIPRFLPADQAVSLSIGAKSFRGEYYELRVTVVTGTPIVRSSNVDVGVLVSILVLGIVIAMSTIGWRWMRHPPRDRRPPSASYRQRP